MEATLQAFREGILALGLRLIRVHTPGDPPPMCGGRYKPGKSPCIDGVLLAPSRSPDWTEGFNGGVLLGPTKRGPTLAVIDIDKPLDPEPILDQYPDRWALVGTPRGFHVYILTSATRRGVWARGDFFPDNYVVSPGSISADGAQYHLLELGMSNRVYQPRKKERRVVVTPPSRTDLPLVSRGERLADRWGAEDSSFVLACYLVHNIGLTDSGAMHCMRIWNDKRGRGKSDRDLWAKVKNAQKYGGRS